MQLMRTGDTTGFAGASNRSAIVARYCPRATIVFAKGRSLVTKLEQIGIQYHDQFYRKQLHNIIVYSFEVRDTCRLQYHNNRLTIRHRIGLRCSRTGFSIFQLFDYLCTHASNRNHFDRPNSTPQSPDDAKTGPRSATGFTAALLGSLAILSYDSNTAAATLHTAGHHATLMGNLREEANTFFLTDFLATYR